MSEQGTEPQAAPATPEPTAPAAQAPADSFKLWARANALWLLREVEFARAGISEEDRAKYNP